MPRSSPCVRRALPRPVRRSTARWSRAAITGARRRVPRRSCGRSVARVVAASQDPNPLVDGRGLAHLRAAGVAVDLGRGRWGQRAQSQNAAFFKATTTGLPLVTYKAAMSLDGKVAAAGGDARWISSPESRRAAHVMRAAADAVMVGAGTVRRDDPSLSVRLAEGRDPVRVVVSSAGLLPAECALLATAGETPTVILASRVDDTVRREPRGARRRGPRDRRGRPARRTAACSQNAACSTSSAKAAPASPAPCSPTVSSTASFSSSHRSSSGEARPISSPHPRSTPSRALCVSSTSAGRRSATTSCCAPTWDVPLRLR